ncbi:MAG: glutamate--tRNA ligase [Gemmatimonadota bacterium]|nr:glutamate--tRNA ligase [Gemmatimonadota bacterium]
MTRKVRTRFAPSPTGQPHLGNARTAILNWLYARNQGGAFVLRFEDTDTARNVEGGEQAILDALDWLGLDRDEGPDVGGDHGPYRQSERGELYLARARGLVADGHAFRCFCTPEEMEADRVAAIAAGEPPGRDRRCRDLDPIVSAGREAEAPSAGEEVTLRLRVDSGPVAFEDRLKGALSIDGDDLGDMVLVRPDGRPTYNFAVAVDDFEMQISHVIRGIGHLSNTPKQVLLYRAFGAPPPEFIHIPSVLAEGGGKLAKRAGAPGVLDYRDEGFTPDAILNYLSLLAWSSATGEEVLTRRELIEQIDLDRLGATDAEVDPEKLRWLSGQHLRRQSAVSIAAAWAGVSGVAELGLSDEDLVRAAEVFVQRTSVLTDAPEELAAVFADPDLRTEAAREVLASPDASLALETLAGAWEETDWDVGTLKASMRNAMQASGVTGKSFFQPTRMSLMGATHGPDLTDVAYALGEARTRRRLARALELAHDHRRETE